MLYKISFELFLALHFINGKIYNRHKHIRHKIIHFFLITVVCKSIMNEYFMGKGSL